MKKIIRFSLVFALSCAALLNTGCTKDFESDLNAVRKDLDDFQKGTFQSVKDQVANLETQLSNLIKVDETIKGSVSALEKTVAELSKKVEAAATDAELATVKADLATVKSDVAILKSTGAAIQKDIEAIKTDIAALKTDKADKKWVESTFATLADQKKIQEDLAKATTQLTTLSNQLTTLSTELSKLQTKEADDVTKLNDELGKLNGSITDINTALGQVTIVANDAKKLATENYEWLGKLQTYVDGLYTNAQIDEMLSKLKEELENETAATYSTKIELEAAKTAIEGQLATLEQNLIAEAALRAGEDSDIRTAFAAADEAIETAYKEADEKLKIAYKAADEVLKTELGAAISAGDEALQSLLEGKISDLEDALEGKISANATKIGEILTEIGTINEKLAKCATKEELSDAIALEVADRNTAIADAKTELEGKIAEVAAKLKELAGRVISISVLPIEKPELTYFELGDSSSIKFEAQFLVQPAAAIAAATDAELIKALGLEWLYGLNKGEAKKITPAADTLAKVVKNGGIVSITTFFTESTEALKANTVPYYAITYKGKDGNGEYSVTSDFAEAKQVGYDLIDDYDFVPVYVNTTGITAPVPTCLADTISVEYTKVSEVNRTPFAGKVIKFKAKDKIYTTEEFAKEFGLTLNVDPCKAATPDTIFTVTYPTDGNIVPFTVEGVDAEFPMSVGKTFNYGIDSIKVNGVKFDESYALQTIKVTRISRHIKIDTLKFQWNWKNWASFTDTLRLNNDDWYGEGGFAQIESRPFDHLTITDKTVSPLEFRLKQGEGWPTSVVIDSLVVGKNNDSDSMTFHMPVKIYGGPVIDTVKRQAASKLLFAINSADSIAVPFVTDVIAKAGGVKAYTKNLSGDNADSVNFVNAFASSVSYASSHGVMKVKVNGVLAQPVISVDADSLQLKFPAGTFVYGNEYTVTIDNTTYGISYVYEYTFTADDAPYGLKTLPYIVNGYGEVRGQFVGNVYTLDQMYFAKYLRVFGNIPASDVSHVKVKIDTVTEHGIVDGANGNLEFSNFESTSPIVIDIDDTPIVGTDNEYSLNQNSRATWNSYTGRNVTFLASLCVDDVAIGTPVKFTLWTAKPVSLERFDDNDAIRTAATDYTFQLNKGAVVYGVEEGKLVTVTSRNLITKQGSEYKFRTDYTYPDTKFVYRYDLMEAYINGFKTTLVEGIDYTIADKTKDEIVIKGDNCVGDVVIKIPVELQYYLDYSHYNVDTKVAMIHLKQN